MQLRFCSLLLSEELAARRWLCHWLEESSTDFRVGAEALKSTRFAVFGCGNSLYGDNFNKVLTPSSLYSHSQPLATCMKACT